MPFITKSSLGRILREIRIENIPDYFIQDSGQVWFKSISQFSWAETKTLLFWKTIYRDPSGIEVIYQRSEKKDSYTYLDEAKASSYHQHFDCEFLHAGFRTYVIPQFIRDKGNPDIVKSFRTWYKLNIKRLGGPEELHTLEFYAEMKSIFGESESMDRENRDHVEEIEEQGNPTLEDLKHYIEKGIDELWEFYHQQPPQVQEVIRLYCKSSKMGYSVNPIRNNTTRYSDEALKQFLKGYHERYKQPLMDNLREYYRVYFNPELDFEGHLLDMLNFKPCSYCYS